MPTHLSRRNLAAVTRLPADRVSHRLFFFSESLPQGAYNVHHAYAPVDRLSIAFDQVPGWPGSIATFASTILPLEGGGYRLYGTVRPDPPADGLEMRVWDSPDALRWSPVPIQPEGSGMAPNRLAIDGVPGDSSFMGQPQIVPLRDGRWRAYFWKHRDGHLRYVVAETGPGPRGSRPAPPTSDLEGRPGASRSNGEDGLHWQVPDFGRPALYHPLEGGLWTWAQGLAPDVVAQGLTLSPEEAQRHKRLSSNDATYVYYNDRLDRYECYSVWLHPAVPDRRVDVDNAPGVHRLIHRRLSADGLEWGDPELILMPDARDPWDLQFYYMAMQWHEDWQIASVGYYRVEAGQQTQDLMLCFSRDGRAWQRPVRGGLTPRRPGEVDSMGVYAPNVWLDLGDRWLVLYTGTPDAHNASRESRQGVIPLGATLRKNRFVGLATGVTPGGFLTEPFIPAAPQITVDADISGWLRAELCDAFGRKLPGHHLMDALLLQGDSEAHVLRWRDQPADAHRYEAVRLRFEFAEGIIYGVGF